VPELPEVETVRRTIEPHVVGRRIASVEVRERRLRRPVPVDFADRLVGRRIHAVARRAKYLLLDVDDRPPVSPRTECPGDDGRLRWVVHLGMSGRFCVGEPPDLPHVHVVAALDDGTRLWFRDPRRFGAMFVTDRASDLGTIGVEPLGGAFDGEMLWRETRRHRRVAIKNLVMDQRIVAGVGNIYANEALFDAGVRPSRRAGRVTRAEAGRIADAVRAVQVAVERVFSQHNVRTVMGTAQAAGAALTEAARAGLPVTLRTPSEVKAAVTGAGRADKAQVAAMVTRLLRLDEVPRPADASDALALAIAQIWRGSAEARLQAAARAGGSR